MAAPSDNLKWGGVGSFQFQLRHNTRILTCSDPCALSHGPDGSLPAAAITPDALLASSANAALDGQHRHHVQELSASGGSRGCSACFNLWRFLARTAHICVIRLNRHTHGMVLCVPIASDHHGNGPNKRTTARGLNAPSTRARQSMAQAGRARRARAHLWAVRP